MAPQRLEFIRSAPGSGRGRNCKCLRLRRARRTSAPRRTPEPRARPRIRSPAPRGGRAGPRPPRSAWRRFGEDRDRGERAGGHRRAERHRESRRDPAANRPCASANTSTRIAPEQGATPAAITVPAASRQEKRRRAARGRAHEHGRSPALKPPPRRSARNSGDGKVSAGALQATPARPAPRQRPAVLEMAAPRRCSAPPLRQTSHRPMAATPL